MPRDLYVAQTKPREEPRARDELTRQGFEAFYPTELRRRLVRRALAVFAMPIFPSYIFVAFDPLVDRWQAIHGTRGVRRLMCSKERADPIRLPPAVARNLRERSAAPLERPEEVVRLFRRGERVRIVDGPFADHAATVTHYDQSDANVMLLLAFLGRQHEVRVPVDCVEPANL